MFEDCIFWTTVRDQNHFPEMRGHFLLNISDQGGGFGDIAFIVYSNIILSYFSDISILVEYYVKGASKYYVKTCVCV